MRTYEIAISTSRHSFEEGLCRFVGVGEFGEIKTNMLLTCALNSAFGWEVKRQQCFQEHELHDSHERVVALEYSQTSVNKSICSPCIE